MNSPRPAQDGDAFGENLARALVRHQIEIALAITRFDIRQAMPFVGQGPQALGQHFKRCTFRRRLARLGEKATSLHSDEIPQVKQSENLHRLRAELLCLHINLNPPGCIAQIEKVALPHVAVRGDPPRRAQRRAFGKFFAYLAD